MDNKPIFCLLCDGVMAAVERYEKHLRIDHRVVCRVNWIVQNTLKGDHVDIKKEVEDSTIVGEESSEKTKIAEVTEFIEEAMVNGTLGSYENLDEENSAHTSVENDDESLMDESFDANVESTSNLNENDIGESYNLMENDRRDDYNSMENAIGESQFPPVLIINPRSGSNKTNEGYGCSLCPDKMFKAKEKVKQHMKVHISQEDQDKVLCLECNQGFLNSDSLKEHMKLCEGIEELYFCPVKNCEVSIENSEDLKQHKKTHNLDTKSKKSNKLDSTNEKKFPCNSCDKVFKRNNHLKRHSALHSDNVFACDSCEKVFKRMDQVKRHAATHTNTNFFPCETCQKTFSRKDHMMEHQKSAHETKLLNI